jgi:hypothetical protein
MAGKLVYRVVGGDEDDEKECLAPRGSSFEAQYSYEPFLIIL